MYGHGLGNVTARVRKREGQKTNWVHFSRNAIEERRFIVRATVAAFPTVPLLQQAGILYRRPLRVSKWRTKSVFHIWAHAHIHTLKLGIGRAHTRPQISITYNHSGRERNTDSYPKQSQKSHSIQSRVTSVCQRNPVMFFEDLNPSISRRLSFFFLLLLLGVRSEFGVQVQVPCLDIYPWQARWEPVTGIVWFPITKTLVKD